MKQAEPDDSGVSDEDLDRIMKDKERLDGLGDGFSGDEQYE
jgi:hypothetical protein